MSTETVQRVLVVDDDDELRTTVCEALQMEGYATCEAGDGVAAVEVFRLARPDAVLLDLQMPRREGLATLEELRALAPDVPVIMLSGRGDISSAVRALKGGAYDYIEKPPDFDRIVRTLHQALDRRRLQGEVQRISTALDNSLESRFGCSPAIRGVLERVKRVAPTNMSVVLQGETGTGKSYIARAIHDLSRRAGGAYVRVDVSVIPATLVESELFGSRKGSYTGADRDRPGCVASANGGTLFLDDIENIPLEIQAKLLDVLETRRVSPVGGGERVELDFRVITATNRDLQACVAAQTFREDLLYRLGEFVIDLPPLRERPEDIRFFMDLFLLDAGSELDRQVHGFSDDAVDLLMRHRWPGNVRELRNVVRRATLLAPGDVVEHGQIDFIGRGTESSSGCGRGLSLRESLQDLEKKLVSQALAKTGGNKSRAAELLKTSYPNLLSKVKEYGIGE